VRCTRASLDVFMVSKPKTLSLRRLSNPYSMPSPLNAHSTLTVKYTNSRSPTSSIDVPALQEDLSDVLASAAELSNTRAAKVVGYRSEQHATLDLGSFLGFFNESWSFVVKCEVLCRRMIVGLRGAVVSQVRLNLFLHACC
jgi:vacuolar protein sorting-associated protein 54